ncbi:helix-turn-helix domain-containing protein [Anabaena cylindrica UHCC 0172]|uniref:helix-turn-helix domain-containing protein n=1 Tax=Anabaena cylindrica TaxID=1165 RepID=UPI002B2202E4|nr:helix-turn-helix domain-containing protein [Anabaena cylindrica]MEA5549387.1 helix-turn-helix domain-containing protein [Anabaena cylindrica UHCC 0172]
MTTFLSNQNKSTVSNIVTENETEAIKQLAELLKQANSQLRLVANGQEVAVSDSVFNVLREIVREMALGNYVSIITYNPELTTQQAADLLNVSRPYLIKLLEQGELPYIMVGTHRRVRFSDLMKYKEDRDITRRKSLQELIEITEEAGLYDYED